MNRKFATLPNLITSVRIVLLPVALYYFMKSTLPAYIISLVLVILMELSDLFDGIVARKLNSASNVGKIFDPFADHIYRISFFLFFSLKGFIPIWMFLVCFYRDSLVMNVRIFASGQNVFLAARKSGKIKAQFQSTAIILFIVLQIANFAFRITNLDKIYYLVMYAVVTVTLWSAFDYFFSVMEKRPKRLNLVTFTAAFLILLAMVIQSDYHRVIFQSYNLFKWDLEASFKKILPGYNPLGIAVDQKNIYISFAKSGSPALLTRFRRGSYELERRLEFPGAIQQPCGLALRQERLWLIDSNSGKLLVVLPEKSFTSNQLVVEHELETGLEGASGLTFVSLHGQPLLAISVFLKEGVTYLVDYTRTLQGIPFSACILHRIKNYNFSQGLAASDGFLYDANSFLGFDRVFKIDLNKAVANESYNGAVVEVFNSPNQMIKDIDILGDEIWTTDEYRNGLHKGTLRK